MSDGESEDVELLSDYEEISSRVKPEASDASEAEVASDCDSDKELQIAFKKGLLKPGLNFPVDAPKTFVNNVAGMQQKLLDLKQSLKWPERLDLIPAKAQPFAVTSKKSKPSALNNNLSDSAPAPDVEDIDDDFKREMTFCHLAQLAVLEAIPRLHTAGVVTKRPEDYFAEMAKSDAHMQRIREKLVQKKAEIENRSRARQMRQLRKESKYIQEEVLKRRQAEKKLLNDVAKKYGSDAKSKEDLEEMLAGKKKGRPTPQAKDKTQFKVNKRRDWKNKKFGFGGQKKRSKRNTADSVDDYSNKKKKNNAPFTRINQNKSGSAKRLAKKKQRPGKVARSRDRQKRSNTGGARKR